MYVCMNAIYEYMHTYTCITFMRWSTYIRTRKHYCLSYTVYHHHHLHHHYHHHHHCLFHIPMPLICIKSKYTNTLKEREALMSVEYKENRLKTRHISLTQWISGPGSVVSIGTGYGLDGLGIESRKRQDFPHLSRPALGPTQPPVQ